MMRTGIALGALSVFYAGMIVGVSFFATSIKFLAQTPSRGELLEVGRVTFNGFMWIEFGLAGALVVAAWLCNGLARRRVLVGMTLCVAGIVLVQHLGVRPGLDERVGVVMEGGTPGESSGHMWYAVLEVVKLVGVVGVGWLGWRALGCAA